MGSLANYIFDSDYRVSVRKLIFIGCGPYAVELRWSGKLVELGKHIKCLVVAIYDDNDPHPTDGGSQGLVCRSKE